MAANFSVVVARRFLLYRSRLAAVPALPGPRASQTGGAGRRRADGRAGPAQQRD
jgi:hypothetical protein